MPAPPPEPPRPGLSPPPGDMAREPLPPVPGSPTFEPGCDDTTIPEPLPEPPSGLGGARTEPTSPGPPRPEPLRPEPESPGPEPIEGGGGTTLAPRPLPKPLGFPLRVPPTPAESGPPTEGGGGITLEPSEPPREFPTAAARELPAPDAPVVPDPTVGGGGMTVEPSPVPRAVPAPFSEETAGGGGTTFCVPKSFPMMLLTNPEFAAVGGGGT